MRDIAKHLMRVSRKAGFLLFGALGAGFVLGGTFAQHGPFSAEMASWAQAMGGMAAIAAAWLLGARQVEAAHSVVERQIADQEARALKQLQDLRESGLAALVVSTGRLSLIPKVIEQGSGITRDSLQATLTVCCGSKDILAAFPIHFVSAPEAMSWYLEAQSQVELLIRFMERFVEIAGDRELTEKEADAMEEQILNNFRSVGKAMNFRIDLYAKRFDLIVPTPAKVEI